MIWILIPIAIAAVLTLLVWGYEQLVGFASEWYNWTPYLIAVVLCSLALIFFSLPATVGMRGRADNERYFDAKLHAISVRSTSKLKGSFFLGCGSISTDSGPRFWFYRELGKGVILQNVSPCYTLVIEEDVEQPFVRIYTDGESSWDLFWGWQPGARARQRQWEFHVPVGSIAPVVDIGLGG